MKKELKQMANKKFIEKIVSFYPYNTMSPSGVGTNNKSTNSPVFYFTYNELPASFNVSFEVALGALNFNNKYKLQFEIYKDTDELIISSSVDIDPSTLPKENLIYEDYISRTFDLTSAYFTVTPGEHAYIASITVLDDNDNKLDKSSTWFVTNQ